MPARSPRRCRSTVTTVGVFVNEPVDAIRETARVAGLRMVQLHGEETPAYVEQIEQPVMRAVTLDTMVETAKTWPAEHDAAARFARIRRGAAPDGPRWIGRARPLIARGRRVVLAGGLTPDNIEEAIVTVRPIGVDVSSGVESAPGVKDLDKVARFLANARTAFARVVNP